MKNKSFKLSKFWSLKDTVNYSFASINNLFSNPNMIRIFYFKKSYLLKVKLERINNEEAYVTPTMFLSDKFPRGHYTCVYRNKKYNFADSDILEVVN